MEKQQQLGKKQAEQNLSPIQKSWVGYWDKWYKAALRAGNMPGAFVFMGKSIKIIEGVDVPEMIAPKKPSITDSFENPNDYKTHFYSW